VIASARALSEIVYVKCTRKFIKSLAH
jgi:hypothetical protein